MAQDCFFQLTWTLPSSQPPFILRISCSVPKVFFSLSFILDLSTSVEHRVLLTSQHTRNKSHVQNVRRFSYNCVQLPTTCTCLHALFIRICLRTHSRLMMHSTVWKIQVKRSSTHTILSLEISLGGINQLKKNFYEIQYFTNMRIYSSCVCKLGSRKCTHEFHTLCLRSTVTVWNMLVPVHKISHYLHNACTYVYEYRTIWLCS